MHIKSDNLTFSFSMFKEDYNITNNIFFIMFIIRDFINFMMIIEYKILYRNDNCVIITSHWTQDFN